MKRSSPRSRLGKPSSFTLVELLVVIAIIAILAGVILASFNAVIKAAKRAKAAQIANQVQTAVLQYYTEYSVYPVPAGTSTATDVYYNDADVADWEGLSYALCGNINPAAPSSTITTTAQSVPNTHSITFMTPNKTDVDTNGVPANPLPVSTAHPYFYIAIDNTYDGILGNVANVSGTLPVFTVSSLPLTNVITAGVAVWANCSSSTATTNANSWVHTY